MMLPDTGESMGKGESLEVAVARIEERQASFGDKLDTIIEMVSKDSGRIESLEQFKWKLLGAATVIGGVSGLIGKLASHIFIP